MKRLQNFIYNQHSTKYYKSEKNYHLKQKVKQSILTFFVFYNYYTIKNTRKTIFPIKRCYDLSNILDFLRHRILT